VKKIKEAIEGRGGMLNAFTSEEVTCYFVKILRKHLPVAMELLCDLVYNPLFRQSDIDMERTVILEEIKMYMDLPSHYVHDILTSMMWPDQPLGRSVLGTVDTITNMTRADIVKYKGKHYRNANFMVVVCGDVNHADVLHDVRQHVRHLHSPRATTFKQAHVCQRAAMTQYLDKETEQTHFVLGYHTCSRRDKRRYILSLLNIILGANMSSRLFEEVREKRGLAYEIRSSLSLFQDTGAFLISAGVENGKAYSALQVIMREVEKIRSKGVTNGELKRAKDYYLGQLMLLFESTMENMLWHGERILYLNSVMSLDEIRHMVMAVTKDDITKLAKEIFCQNGANFACIGSLRGKEKTRIDKIVA
ncbi:MAG: insulinase family protein, partial [Candidatus Omnitrophica bacterium]|nr:insulinase family protein [Candidatus Omnitrophota bacterium]